MKLKIVISSTSTIANIYKFWLAHTDNLDELVEEQGISVFIDPDTEPREAMALIKDTERRIALDGIDLSSKQVAEILSDIPEARYLIPELA